MIPRNHPRAAALALVLWAAWCLPAFAEAQSSESEVEALIFESASRVKPLAIGARVPEVDLRNIDGERVALGSFVGEAPLAVVFYRGGW